MINLYYLDLQPAHLTTPAEVKSGMITTCEDLAMEQTLSESQCHDAVQQLKLKMMLCIRHGVFQATDLS